MSRRIETSASAMEGNRLRSEALAEDGKLLFTQWNGMPGAFLVARDRLRAVRLFPELAAEAEPTLLGAIYLGRVKDVTEHLNACFVEYCEGKVGFLKTSRIPKERFPLHQGDLIPVRISALPQRGKRAGLSARIDWKHLPDGERIRELAEHRMPLTLLVPAPDPRLAAVTDLARRGEVAEIVTDDAEVYARFRSMQAETANPLAADGAAHGTGPLQTDAFPSLRLYEDTFPLSKLYKLETRMEEALASRVWLKSGGSVIFDRTEAMTVIDVNTAKTVRNVRGEDSETGFLRLNLEAAEEIAFQLRLRNLSGMVLIDFINLTEEADREALLAAMQDFTSNDPCEVLVFDITKLGLMELTRKKQFPSLWEQVKYPSE